MTTIYGNYTRALSVDAPGVVFRGLTLAGDEMEGDGGAIEVKAGADATFEDCVITGGQQLYPGDYGGGLSVGAGAHATLVRTTLEDNVGPTRGGGLYLDRGATVDLLASAVRGNTDAEAGAIWIGPDAVVTLDVASSVQENLSTGSAAAVHLEAGARLVSDGADWGEGALDNAPADVEAGGTVFGPFGAGAVFTCEAGGCGP